MYSDRRGDAWVCLVGLSEPHFTQTAQASLLLEHPPCLPLTFLPPGDLQASYPSTADFSLNNKGLTEDTVDIEKDTNRDRKRQERRQTQTIYHTCKVKSWPQADIYDWYSSTLMALMRTMLSWPKFLLIQGRRTSSGITKMLGHIDLEASFMKWGGTIYLLLAVGACLRIIIQIKQMSASFVNFECRNSA